MTKHDDGPTGRRFRPIRIEDIPPKDASSILSVIERLSHVDGLINGVERFGGSDYERMYLRTRQWQWFVADPIAVPPDFASRLRQLGERQ